MLGIFSRSESCVISKLLSQLMGNPRAAAGEDYLISEALGFNQFFHLGELFDVDVFLSYCLGNKDSVSVYLFSLGYQFLTRNLGTHVVCNYILESFQTEVTMEALHLDYGIDTYCMSV